MRKVTASLSGIRVVRQSPYECLISFICSSNNNIKRITLMLESIRKIYGNYVTSVKYCCSDELIQAKGHRILYAFPGDGGAWVVFNHSPSAIATNIDPSTSGSSTSSSSSSSSSSAGNGKEIDLYTFPAPMKLAEASEEDLRKLGMGYRAKFISGSSKHVNANKSWCVMNIPYHIIPFQIISRYITLIHNI